MGSSTLVPRAMDGATVQAQTPHQNRTPRTLLRRLLRRTARRLGIQHARLHLPSASLKTRGQAARGRLLRHLPPGETPATTATRIRRCARIVRPPTHHSGEGTLRASLYVTPVVCSTNYMVLSAHCRSRQMSSRNGIGRPAHRTALRARVLRLYQRSRRQRPGRGRQPLARCRRVFTTRDCLPRIA